MDKSVSMINIYIFVFARIHGNTRAVVNIEYRTFSIIQEE